VSEKESGDEALELQLKAAKGFFVPGDNWDKRANHIIARNSLHTDLGRYSGHLQVYHLDEDTRDRLLAYARQDAAEALCHVSTLMDEVRALRKTLNGLINSIFLCVVVFAVLGWWKAGFLADWLSAK
jgi:hypothetical protein